ncbi:hypothetical protein U1Q18_032824, partial [Sarracenia purpurea var. burkii]
RGNLQFPFQVGAFSSKRSEFSLLNFPPVLLNLTAEVAYLVVLLLVVAYYGLAFLLCGCLDWLSRGMEELFFASAAFVMNQFFCWFSCGLLRFFG